MRNTFSRLSSTAVRPALLLAAGLLLAGAAAGCASSGETDFTIEREAIATRSLPSTRDTDHHPDSLADLTLSEENGRLEFELDGSYRDMLLEWSAGQQRLGHSYFRTHATLWSKELSVASLVPEMGVNTLSKDLAREKIAERIAEYDSLLQIDVYVFSPSQRSMDLGDLGLDGAGQRVYLRDADYNQYDPVRIESDVPLEAFQAGRRALYGRNAVFFDRHTETGRDLLDTRELRLYVRPAGYYFTWTFPENAPATSATGAR